MPPQLCPQQGLHCPHSLLSPGPSHVSLQLLQEALPVPDVQVGPPCPDLALNALVQSLQLVVRLPLEHGLHI